jgi:hypothetical protein
MTFLFISLLLPEISYSDRIWVSFISAKGGSKDGEMGVKKGLGWIINMATVDEIIKYSIEREDPMKPTYGYCKCF